MSEQMSLRDWTKDALDWGVDNADLNWRTDPRLTPENTEPIVVAVASGEHAGPVGKLLHDYWESVKSQHSTTTPTP